MPRPSWQQLLAFVAEVGEVDQVLFDEDAWNAHCAALEEQLRAGGADDAVVEHAWRSVLEDDVDEIVSSYPWLAIRDRRLVGLPTPDGEPWTTEADPAAEGADPSPVGGWFVVRSDGSVAPYPECKAHPRCKVRG